MNAVIRMVVGNLETNRLAPRGCLVRVRCGTDPTSRKERWFAVGIYFQRLAEAAVCNLPQIESTNVVFARRSLKRTEIELLRLRRGQIVECSVSNDAILVGAAVMFDLPYRPKSNLAAQGHHGSGEQVFGAKGQDRPAKSE
jgi:hypothetical protein